MADGEKYDLMIAVVSALTLIFMIMLLLTRSVVAALVIVGTASSSIAASVRTVGADLARPVRHAHPLDRDGAVGHHPVGRRAPTTTCCWSRDSKKRFTHGLKTGYIRSMAGTGAVVTSAGLVFAFTMAAMLGSDLTVLGPVRLDGLHRSAARHPGGANAVHAVPGNHAGPLVLVAPGSPSPRRPRHAERPAHPGRRHRPAAVQKS